MNFLKDEILPNCGNLLSATFSSPMKTLDNIEFEKIRIKLTNPEKLEFSTESYKNPQVFHKLLTGEKIKNFFKDDFLSLYKNVTIETTEATLTILTNKKSEKKLLKKKRTSSPVQNLTKVPHNKTKNYILKEGIPVPFLVELGVMTKEGKIHNQKYDKFRQINRFLEFVDDILPEILKPVSSKEEGQTRPLEITDFGCGKSYLTFALYHYLVVLKGLKANIKGLDLKKDVINHCNDLAKKCGYESLVFSTGDIAEYRDSKKDSLEPLDLVITLHACDTATDYALAYAVEHKAKSILSVPCCQHEINSQLKKQNSMEILNPLLKHGIIKERFSALVTDVLRVEVLESVGYKTQLLEFIDMENTPKNLMIRGVLKDFSTSFPQPENQLSKDGKALKNALNVKQTLLNLLDLQ
ncbi:MAG: SAM-dependent methyltransferase [Treponemataceae bacterium]|nr:SAM-dependent methyltransferase [Treponemataceae bacterium]